MLMFKNTKCRLSKRRRWLDNIVDYLTYNGRAGVPDARGV